MKTRLTSLLTILALTVLVSGFSSHSLVYAAVNNDRGAHEPNPDGNYPGPAPKVQIQDSYRDGINAKLVQVSKENSKDLYKAVLKLSTKQNSVSDVIVRVTSDMDSQVFGINKISPFDTHIINVNLKTSDPNSVRFQAYKATSDNDVMSIKYGTPIDLK